MRSSKGLLVLYAGIALGVALIAGLAMAQGGPPRDNIVEYKPEK